jgi:uncharacterized protein YndB with AHSA1/START domain
MILRERAHAKATAEQIWAVLRDPQSMSWWNPNCVRCEAEEKALRVGLRLQTVMRFGGGPEREVNCEVIECQPNRSLTLRFSGKLRLKDDEHVDETVELQPVKHGTKILHRVDFSHAGLPWFIRVLMKIIHLIGRQRSASVPACLKELAEGSGHDE